jgi:predicted deacylase
MISNPNNFKARIILIITCVIALCGGLALYFFTQNRTTDELPQEIEELVAIDNEQEDIQPIPKIEVIGTSALGRKIEAYTYGAVNDAATNKLMFVGGIHGGYEWNTVILAYKFIDYFTNNPQVIPEDVQVTIVPSANPDGLYKVVGKEGRFAASDIPAGTDESLGRFNANNVDLNRNFACKWKPESSWRGKTVSAGIHAFSEPEAQAIRNVVVEKNPDAVIFWHSQGDAVFASECNNGILQETLDIMSAYAIAAGYTPIESFDAYEISGDAEGWLASINIPALTVELKTHQTIEWEQNLAGVKALFMYYSKKI